ncbi:hypothetical protein LTR84_001248 [Exophiala bonariae]|uniref:AB hydrolase-1 domain-containing protein n=1 Tax=Exophiala bonariae TaxID=1690606 RepID=A0AAV9NTG6_9EURO|nr:hypothetical protein LTR84_001248 [Exophiala bonariae]
MKLSASQLLISLGLCGIATRATPTARSSTERSSTSWTTENGTKCTKFSLVVPVNATNLILEGPRVDSSFDAVTYAWDGDTWSSANATERIKGTISVNTAFNIAAQLCIPSSGGKSDILQIATHGNSFDKRYWDAEVEPENYNYIRAATNAGYSIFTYDRLSVGGSDKPDAYDIVQAPVELEILRGVTEMARSGDISRLAARQIDTVLPDFTKFVHVGHSYGSILTSGLLAKYPDLTDGSILTGFIINPHGPQYQLGVRGYQLASEAFPEEFGHLGSGYICPGAKYNLHNSFFGGGDFDPKILDYGWKIKQPSTVGEGRSAIALLGLTAHNYTKPLQFFLAEFDAPVCNGDCKEAYNLTQIRETIYPNNPVVEVHIQPKTAHGFTLHRNATGGYEEMFRFFGRNGL